MSSPVLGDSYRQRLSLSLLFSHTLCLSTWYLINRAGGCVDNNTENFKGIPYLTIFLSVTGKNSFYLVNTKLQALFPVKHTVCLPLIVTLVASAPMHSHTLGWQVYTSILSLFSRNTHPAWWDPISLYQTTLCLIFLLNQSVQLFWSCWAKANLIKHH